MDNIVVATDLSARSDRAIDRAAILARQFSARLHIVHVIDDELPKSAVDLQLHHVEALLNRQTSDQEACKDLDISIYLLLGDAWCELLELAESKTADLIVLGTHRSRGFMDRFSGTTVARIAAASTIPVLVVAQRVSGAYSRPLIGVDFSDCARNAARFAARIAPNQKLTLLNAYHIPFRALTARTSATGEISMKDRQRAEAELDLHMRAFEKDLDMSQAYEWLLVEGSPAAVLDRESRRLGADLICVGPHARSWLSRSLLGSTAEQLLVDPPCDVLVVPL